MLSWEIGVKERELFGKSQGSYFTELLLLLLAGTLEKQGEARMYKSKNNNWEDPNYMKYIYPLLKNF